MGSVSLKIGDGTARFKRATLCSSAVNGLMLLSVLTTNLFALYAFSRPNTAAHPAQSPAHKNISLITEQVSLIMAQIQSSQKRLAQVERDLLGYDTIDVSKPGVSPELKAFLSKHPLPLGKDSRTGITLMVSSVGHTCGKSMDLLNQYMKYKPFGPCPDDVSTAQKLVSKTCEPLPRRRCLAKTINKGGAVSSFPDSLWRGVGEKAVNWGGLSCKNFTCLKGKRVNRDCAGCFDLVNGSEGQRFVKARGKNDFLIDDVLGLVGQGEIRAGLDIAGGSGTFAARMAERGVAVMTQALNVDGPFNEFISARGLFPVFMSLDHRFPFYDGAFDLVHAGGGLDGWGARPERAEFLMFDVDRVLRAGGLLWLDNYYCASEERKREMTRMIERFGFKKLKWVVGEKASGEGKTEVYLSAVLQKPVRA